MRQTALIADTCAHRLLRAREARGAGAPRPDLHAHRRLRRPRGRPLDLHAGDDRDGEYPAQRHRPQPGADGRGRPRHQHLRRPVARLGLRGVHRREIRAFTLFATHYFELTSLAGEAPGVANVHVEAVEHGDKLVFLHSVREGPANQSYGLQVAALAGIPGPVIAQARRYLTELERERDALRNRARRKPNCRCSVRASAAASARAAPHPLGCARCAARHRPGLLEPARSARLAVSAQASTRAAGTVLRRAKRPSRRKAAVCRRATRREQHAAWLTGSTSARSRRRGASPRPVRAIVGLLEAQRPDGRGRTTSIAGDDAELAPASQRRVRRVAAPPRPCRGPSTRRPNGRRASACAAALPLSGEPSSTTRPGGSGRSDVVEQFRHHDAAQAVARPDAGVGCESRANNCAERRGIGSRSSRRTEW